MPLIYTQVGPAPVSSNSTNPPLRSERTGGLVVTELNGKYYEQAYQGNVFFTANQAAVTFAANGLTSLSAVGLAVYNPASSGKNIIPLQAELVMTNFITTSTDVQVVAVVSAYSALAPASASALTIYNAKTAGNQPSGSVALAASSLTFAANSILWKALYSAFVTTTIAAAIPTPSVMPPYDFNGALILPPGTGLALIANNASTGIASISWMELPV